MQWIDWIPQKVSFEEVLLKSFQQDDAQRKVEAILVQISAVQLSCL